MQKLCADEDCRQEENNAYPLHYVEGGQEDESCVVDGRVSLVALTPLGFARKESVSITVQINRSDDQEELPYVVDHAPCGKDFHPVAYDFS